MVVRVDGYSTCLCFQPYLISKSIQRILVVQLQMSFVAMVFLNNHETL